jgi:hypothetical protein
MLRDHNRTVILQVICNSKDYSQFKVYFKYLSLTKEGGKTILAMRLLTQVYIEPKKHLDTSVKDVFARDC